MIVPAWVIVAATAALLLFVIAGGRISLRVLGWIAIVIGVLGAVFWVALGVAGVDPRTVLADLWRHAAWRLEQIPSPIPVSVLSFWLFLNALGLITAAGLAVAASGIRALARTPRPLGAAPPPFVLAGLFTANAAFAFAREPLAQMLGW